MPNRHSQMTSSSRQRGMQKSEGLKKNSKVHKRLPPLHASADMEMLPSEENLHVVATEKVFTSTDFDLSDQQDPFDVIPKSGRMLRQRIQYKDVYSATTDHRMNSKQKSNDSLNSAPPTIKTKGRKRVIKSRLTVRPPDEQQWTNIVKKVNLQRPVGNRVKPKSKKKDAFLTQRRKVEITSVESWPSSHTTQLLKPIERTGRKSNANAKRLKPTNKRLTRGEGEKNLSIVHEVDTRRSNNQDMTEHESSVDCTSEKEAGVVRESSPQVENRSLTRPITVRCSSKSGNSSRVNNLPKTGVRETTPMNHVNIGDFADFDRSSRPMDNPSPNSNDYQYRISKRRSSNNCTPISRNGISSPKNIANGDEKPNFILTQLNSHDTSTKTDSPVNNRSGVQRSPASTTPGTMVFTLPDRKVSTTPDLNVPTSPETKVSAKPDSKVSTPSDTKVSTPPETKASTPSDTKVSTPPDTKKSTPPDTKASTTQLQNEHSNTTLTHPTKPEAKVPTTRLQHDSYNTTPIPSITPDTKIPNDSRDMTPPHSTTPDVKVPAAKLQNDNYHRTLSHSTTPENLPQLYGSPPPIRSLQTPDDDYCAEISISVPKLPSLNVQPVESISDYDMKQGRSSELGEGESGHHSGDEPLVIVTAEDGTPVKGRSGWDSGYSSMTPRLSIDSRSHALSPMSSHTTGSVFLEVPCENRTISSLSISSIGLDITSRPQSSFLEVPQFIGTHDTYHENSIKKFAAESHSSLQKLPSIITKRDSFVIDETDETDENIVTDQLKPLTIHSVKPSDDEMSDY